MKEEHNHYFKPCPYDTLDVYRVINIFGVTDPCIQHALKKLLCSGVRGHKDQSKDIQDVIDTLERWKQMREEDVEITSSEAVLPKVSLSKASQANADIDSPVEKWYPADSGEWVEYDGSGQPVGDDELVDVLLLHERDAHEYKQKENEAWRLCWDWDWFAFSEDENIVAYKVVSNDNT